MNIASLQNYQYNIPRRNNPGFTSIIYNKNTFPYKKKFNDILEIENIKTLILHDNKEIKSINYNTPQTVLQTFKHLFSSKLYQIRSEFKNGNHSGQEIIRIISDLKTAPEIANIMVSSLYALGAYAYVFQTTDDDVLLKITPRNHFPENREIEEFDAPIYKYGRLPYGTYYYLTEKLYQDDITQEEIYKFCNKITKAGFTLYDIQTPFLKGFLTRQFGKDKNGKLYLCDPGCAIQPETRLSFFGKIKRAIIELFNSAINEIT